MNSVEEIYARIPKLNCKQKCQECCGPIGMSNLEWQRLVQSIGYQPAKPTILEETNSFFLTCGTCPLLSPHDGTCLAYDARPLICRIWGVVKKMRCPYGCVPERWLSDKEAGSLLVGMTKLSLTSPIPK